MIRREVVKCIVEEGELRRKLLKLAEEAGVSRASMKFGRLRVRVGGGCR